MTELKGIPPQRLGRPRAFTDPDAFVATAEAIKKHGYKALTINHIAEELDCTAPALASRFGSKYGLLRAYQEWGNRETAKRFEVAKQNTTTPLDALRYRVYRFEGETPHEIGDLETQINILGFHVLAWTDPELHDLEAERRTMFLNEIISLLEASVISGQLKGCDPEKLGSAMVTAIAGASLQWVPNPKPDVGAHLLEVIDELLKPYLVDATTSD